MYRLYCQKEIQKKGRTAMKKRLLRRVATFGMSILMAFGMINVRAAQGESASGNGKEVTNANTGTITVRGLGQEGSTYDQVKAYKMIDIHYDEKTNEIIYSWAKDEIGALAKQAGYDSVEDYTKGGDKAAKRLYEEIAKKISTGELTVTPIEPKETASGTAVFRDLSMGQYVLFAEGNYVYAPMTGTLEPEVLNGTYHLRDVFIEAKAEKPSIDKKIKDGSHGNENDSVGVKDKIKFRLETKVPNFPEKAVNKTFRLKDTMQEGLMGVEDFSVYNGNQKLSENTDYRVTYYSDREMTKKTENEKNACSFQIEFLVDSKNVSGASLIIDYVSNATAKMIPGTASENKVTLEWPKNVWKQDSDYNTKDQKVKVYTYGIKVIKYDDENKKLFGAEFMLYKDQECKEEVSFSKESEGIYHVATEEEVSSSTLAVNKDGQLTMKGLDEGNYYLKETKAPTGYALSKEVKKVTIQDSGSESHQLTGKLKNDTDAYADVTVINKKGVTLPKTGDMGMFMLTVFGTMMALSGIGIFFLARKKPGK